MRFRLCSSVLTSGIELVDSDSLSFLDGKLSVCVPDISTVFLGDLRPGERGHVVSHLSFNSGDVEALICGGNVEVFFTRDLRGEV